MYLSSGVVGKRADLHAKAPVTPVTISHTNAVYYHLTSEI